MKRVTSLSIGILICNFVSGQDLIETTSGAVFKANVIELNDSIIKYYKYDNLTGPLYTSVSSTILRIVYANGTIDTITNYVKPDGNFPQPSKNNTELLRRGNAVYVESVDAYSLAGENYFLEAFQAWNYWVLVKNRSEADFILEFSLEKKGLMKNMARVIIKTRNGYEVQRSKQYKSSPTAFNGYNAIKAASRKVVKKHLRKTFK